MSDQTYCAQGKEKTAICVWYREHGEHLMTSTNKQHVGDVVSIET